MSDENTATSNQPHKGSTEAPQVSVIIPTYNNAPYIGQALDSVFSQNYHDYEVIVIDDGSTDDTQQVLEPYQDRIRYVYQENAGSAVARNTGLDLARGEFIVFLDADDLLLPGKLKEQAAYLTLRPSLGLVHSGWRLIDENGTVIKDVEPWNEAPTLDLETWLRYKPIRMGAMMFRRLQIKRVNGFDPVLRQSQDVDLLLRLALANCPAEWIYRPTFCYRIYDESTIRRGAVRQPIYLLAVLDKFFRNTTLPDHIRQQEQQIYYYTLLWLSWYLYRTDNIVLMSNYLEKTLEFSPYNRTTTIISWSVNFLKWDVRQDANNYYTTSFLNSLYILLKHCYLIFAQTRK